MQFSFAFKYNAKCPLTLHKKKDEYSKKKTSELIRHVAIAYIFVSRPIRYTARRKSLFDICSVRDGFTAY